MCWLILVLGVIVAGTIYAIVKTDALYFLIFFLVACIIALIFAITNSILWVCIEKTEIYDTEEYSLILIDNEEKTYLIYNTDSHDFLCLIKDKNGFLETKTIPINNIKVNDSENKNPRLIIEHRQVSSPLIRFLFFFDSTESYKIYIPNHSTKYIEGD